VELYERYMQLRWANWQLVDAEAQRPTRGRVVDSKTYNKVRSLMIRNVFDLLSLKTFPKKVEPTATNIGYLNQQLPFRRDGKNYGEIHILPQFSAL